MNVVRDVGALILLMCTTTTFAQEVAGGDFHPSDAQVKVMEQSCAVNDPGMLALAQRVSAGIADWKQSTAEAGPVAAMRQLDAVFDQVRSHGGLSGLKSIYVLCVEKALRQFVEARREEPQAIAGTGNSSPLQRSSFASEESMWRQGCEQAESDAVSQLQSRCGERTFAVVTSDCAQLSGGVRTYIAQVQGECRGK